jgi:hypothetical protein
MGPLFGRGHLKLNRFFYEITKYSINLPYFSEKMEFSSTKDNKYINIRYN